MIKTTLCYIQKDDCFLMLLRNKEKNDINEGKWLGIGGHVEDNETVEEANIREIKEETGLVVNKAIKRGIVYFHSDDIHEEMHLFTCNDFNGEIKECDEGTLAWIKISNLLSLNLWEGDKFFLKPLIETDKIFEMEFFYKKDKLISVRIIK